MKTVQAIPTVLTDVIRIESIKDRLTTGVSQPFVCGGADGDDWIVKSTENASHDALVREFVVSTLGREFHLPVVDFSIVDVPVVLIENSRFPSVRDLGSGLAFGSRKVAQADDLRPRQVVEIPDTVRSRLLFFDWWTQNLDRQLTNQGGNPNLLFDPKTATLQVIDHDNALDQSFDRDRFSQNHAFRDSLRCWRPEDRESLTVELDSLLARLPEIWSDLPDEWLYDNYGDPRSLTTLVEAEDILSRYQRNDQFWKLPGS